MRKLVVLCLAAGMIGCVSLPKLHVGVGASAVIPEESTLENTYMLDGFVRVDALALQAEVSVGYKKYDYDPDGAGAQEGELTQIPVAATLRYMAGPGLIRLIVGGGLVWNINDIDEIATINGIDDAVGYRGILGIDIKVIDDVRISIEAIYDFNEADIDAVAGGSTVDTSGVIGRVAIAYNF
jgi:hypothetical protein